MYNISVLRKHRKLPVFNVAMTICIYTKWVYVHDDRWWRWRRRWRRQRIHMIIYIIYTSRNVCTHGVHSSTSTLVHMLHKPIRVVGKRNSYASDWIVRYAEMVPRIIWLRSSRILETNECVCVCVRVCGRRWQKSDRITQWETEDVPSRIKYARIYTDNIRVPHQIWCTWWNCLHSIASQHTRTFVLCKIQ